MYHRFVKFPESPSLALPSSPPSRCLGLMIVDYKTDFFNPQSVAVFTHERSVSATLHAWAMQPRGVNGASASATSLIEPTHASPRWSASPCKKRRAPARSSECSFIQASRKGPINHGHTVP